MTDDTTNNVTSIFDRFGGKQETKPRVTEEVRPAPAKVASAPSLVPYRAFVRFVAGEERVRVRMRYTNGKQEYWSYVQLINVMMGTDGQVGLLFNQGGIFVDGENLGGLFDALQENSIKELVAFDPARHEAPHAGEPVITRLAAQAAQALQQQYNQ